MTTRKTPAPITVGSRMTVRGIPCVVFKVRPAGTVDVLSEDGSKAFRVSGLAVQP